MAVQPISVSLSDADLEFIDEYQKLRGVRSRTEVVREALDVIRTGRPPAAQFTVPAANHDYSEMLLKAERLVLVFNDMRRWIDNHRHCEALRLRMTNRLHTRILLLHPKSPIIKFIAELSGKTEIIDGENRQIHDIRYAVQKLCSGAWDIAAEAARDNVFKVIGHRRFNTYSMVLDERLARVVYYPISFRYNQGVIWNYVRGELEAHAYEDFLEDVTELERISVTHKDHDLVQYFRSSDA